MAWANNHLQSGVRACSAHIRRPLVLAVTPSELRVSETVVPAENVHLLLKVSDEAEDWETAVVTLFRPVRGDVDLEWVCNRGLDLRDYAFVSGFVVHFGLWSGLAGNRLFFVVPVHICKVLGAEEFGAWL
jgi:hypothetical protein